jgi:broad specificity phosphatase PhoE
MALLIARHGETALNVARVVQPPDTGLSPRGLLQAEALGERLAREHRVQTILTSDLARAHRTAERVAARLSLTLASSPDWRERNFGVLRGRPYDSLGFDPVAMREAPDGGESLEQFEARVARAWAALVAKLERLDPDHDLLLVTHGLVLRGLLEHHVADAAHMASLPLGNTALVVVNLEEGQPRLALGPCTAHCDHAHPAANRLGQI